MSHEVEMMSYTGATPWHGLGTRLVEGITLADAFTDARANGDKWALPLELRPLYFEAAHGMPQMPQAQAVIREDGHPISVVGDRYKLIQPSESVEFLDALVASDESLKLSAVGTLKGGTRLFITTELEGSEFEVGKGDVVKPYLVWLDSFDGSCNAHALNSSTRVVCNNTFKWAMKDAKSDSVAKIRHSGNIAAKLEAAQAQVQAYREGLVGSIEVLRDMAAKSVSSSRWQGLLDEIVPVPEARPTKAERTRDILTDLFEGKGKGSRMAGRTQWGAYNAVTEYTSHLIPTRGTKEPVMIMAKRLEGATMGGAGQRLNDKAFDFLRADA